MLCACVIAALVYAGTGGVVDARRLSYPDGTSFHDFHVPASHTVGAQSAVATAAPVVHASLPDLIAELQAYLSLSVVDVSKVLGVSRQTIYDWSSGKQTPQLATQSKLLAAYALAKEWNEIAGPAGETVRRRFADKPQIIDAFKALDRDAVLAIARARAGVATGAPSIAARMRELGFKKRTAAQQLASLEDARW